ncbi:MAG: hypothetical protein Fur0015_00210 [Ignavibacteriales bacterium]
MNYNKIADKYNERYSNNEYENIKTFLKKLIAQNNYQSILEVGCGTGMWLKYLSDDNLQIFGCDSSIGMLEQAKILGNEKIALFTAEKMAIKKNKLDLIFCMNAFHHFSRQKKFISDCYELLDKNGSLVIISVNPNYKNDSWYMYKYFDGVYKKDLVRFAEWEQIAEWMNHSGFIDVTINEVQNVFKNFVDDEVLKDKFLSKHNSSQLAGLTDEEYSIGIKKIKAEIETTKAKREHINFVTKITFKAVAGIKNGKKEITIHD